VPLFKQISSVHISISSQSLSFGIITHDPLVLSQIEVPHSIITLEQVILFLKPDAFWSSNEPISTLSSINLRNPIPL
jgi:hypothetical protein